MTLAPPGVLRPGDRVRFDGADHLVVALTGTLVRLRSDDGAAAVVLAAYLMASQEFAVAGSDPLPAVEPFGLLDGLPAQVLEDAREYLRNAKLQLSAVLAPEDEVPGLYLHPDHRRRLRRDPVRSDLNV